MPSPPEVLPVNEVLIRTLLALALILLAARAIGGLFVRAGQPRFVGEMIAGVLLGPTLLGGSLASQPIPEAGIPAEDGSGLVNTLFPLQVFDFLNLLGTVTLVLFLLMLGMEVEQKLLRGRGRQITGVSVVLVAVPLVVGFGVGAILDDPGTWKAEVDLAGEPVTATTHALFIGAALSVSASAALARILQERRMLNTDLGAIGMGSSNAITALMFILLGTAVASAKGEGVAAAAGTKLFWAAVLVAVLFLAVRPLLTRLLAARFDPERPLGDTLVAILLLGALASAIAAEEIGINAAIGAFLFGTAVPQIEGLAEAFIERIKTLLVVLLIPVFLAVAGIQTDLRSFEPELIGGLLLFLVALIVTKWVAAVPVAMGLGLDWRESNALGVMLNCRGLEILIVAVVGRQLGVITEPLQSVFVIGAILTTLIVAPAAFRFLPEEKSEEEREKTIAFSMSAIPRMTGGRRVIVAPDRPEAAVDALAEAERFLNDDGPPAQFLVTHLVPTLPRTDYLLKGAYMEATAVPRTLSWLRPAAERLAERGNDAEPASFVTPDPPGDLARLTEEWAATDAIVTGEQDAEALKGIDVALHPVGDAARSRA